MDDLVLIRTRWEEQFGFFPRLVGIDMKKVGHERMHAKLGRLDISKRGAIVSASVRRAT